MGVKSLVKGVLIEQQNKKYARLLASKSMTYDQWIRVREQEQKQMYGDRLKGDLADAEQEREFLFFLQPGVKLAKDALLKLECYFKEHSKVQICYADEDVLKADGTREYPWFKPEWSPDLFDSYYYFGGLVAVRKSLWKQVTAKTDTEIISNIRKCVELAGGFQKGCSAIGHLKEILSHWENVEQMQKCLQISSYGRQREETKEKYTKEKQTQEKLCYEAWEYRAGNVGEKIRPKVSVIIPSKDHPKILENCLQGIGTASGSVSYEILIVDNGSSEENRKR
ncbi:MAG: hypothetical protein IJF07_08640, partial [Lachnospiraceae bacterium]|nr:hypothetical protein [Lachnospiraceae bacterium]